MIAGSTYRIEHCPRCHSEESLRAYARRVPRRESPGAGQSERWQELLRFSFETGSFLKPRAHMARARDAGFALGMLFQLAAGFRDALDACPLDRLDRGLDRDFLL